MRTFILSVLTMLAMAPAIGQYNFVNITTFNQPIDLANCNDTTTYLGDTIVTIGVVVTDGGLSEVASSSVIGGYRPFIHIVDTNANGDAGHYKGIEVQGIYRNAQGAFQANQSVTTLLAGDIVEITGYLDMYNNNLQLNTLDANSVVIKGSQTAPTAAIVPAADLNDANRINKVQTGEPWENAYIKLQNVTVSEVVPFSNGRVSFNVVDGNGNKVSVSDRFLAQKTPAYTTVNPNSPIGAGNPGTFVAPVPGTFYTSIEGILRHEGNGCTGGTSRGYELNPFDDAHYNVGFAPPYISLVERDPLIPNANQDAEITATITDFDGTVDSVAIAWSTNPNAAPSTFTKHKMTLAIGSTDEFEYTIPKQPNGTVVRYYVYAEDNANNVSYYPNTPLTQAEPNVTFYTIRPNGLTIQDIQYTQDPSGDSPYRNQTVSVSGVVTAAQTDYDLGYVYIQDTGVTEYAGLSLIGHPDLQTLYRNQWVRVSGEIVEEFGFTQMIVDQVTVLGGASPIEPVSVNPSDSAAKADGEWEKYESMLVRYENPQGGKIYITNPNANFGDYAVATDDSYGDTKSSLVLAGRQSSSSYSSLWVQLVTDSAYETTDGFMYLPPVETNDTMNMDAIVGIMYYGFSNYRVLPRANDDIIGLNATLDTTINRPVSIKEIAAVAGNVSYFPNPASERFTISNASGEAFDAIVYDLNGRVITKASATRGNNLDVNAASMKAGIYIIRVTDQNNRLLSTGKMVIKP